MVDIKTISVTDQYGLNSLVIDFTIVDTSEELSMYKFNLYKANHQTQNYYLLKSDITDFTYRDFAVNLYDISINYYYKVNVINIATGESKLSTIYGEYKSARADVHALGIVEIHSIYLQNIITNKMMLLKKKRTGQVCTCFDNIRRRSNPVTCTICYGTRYLGGYYSPYEIPVNFLNPPTKIEYFAQNDVGEWEGTPLQLWTQNYPLIQVQDIIVDKINNIRYIVTNCHPSYMNFYLIRQTFQMQRMPDSNVAYQVPMTEYTDSSLPFISIWDTRNTDDPTGDKTIVNLSLATGYYYDCEVFWGDGTSTVLSYPIDESPYGHRENEHKYTTPGVYTIKIVGPFGALLFDSMDSKKILNILQWGKYYKMGIHEDYFFYNYFSGCTNLNISASDSPDVTTMYDASFLFKGLTSLTNNISLNAPELERTQSMFKDCVSFNGKVTILNSKINNATSMFENCTLFDQDLRTIGFDYTGDFDSRGMVKNTSFSTANYDLLLIKFASDSVTYSGTRILDVYNTKYSLGPASTARQKLISQGWEILDGGSMDYHRSLWDTSKTGVSGIREIKLPTVETGNYNCWIDWGDGSSPIFVNSWDDTRLTHTYSTLGIYTIGISGTFEGFKFADGIGSIDDSDKLLEIIKWGTDFKLGTTEGIYLQGCYNLVDVDFETADFSGMVNGQYAFNGCTNLTEIDLSGKTFPDLEDGNGIFYTYGPCEVNLNNTNFPELKILNNAFSGYAKDLLDLSTALLPKLEHMNALCYYADVVEVRLPEDLSSLLQMNQTFFGCEKLLTIDFTGVDLSSLQLMQYTFSNSTKLETLDLSPLDLSNVVSMLSLCNGCVELATIVLPTDLSALEGLSNAFQNCLKLTSLDWSGINMENIQFLDNVFLGCESLSEFIFPSNIAPQNLYGMFSGCANGISLPNLSTLNVSNVIYMNDFLKDTYTHTDTYSSALEYWATLPLQQDVVCNMGISRYNAAGEVAKQYIIDNYNWTFIDAGLFVPDTITLTALDNYSSTREFDYDTEEYGDFTPGRYDFIINSYGVITIDWGDGNITVATGDQIGGVYTPATYDPDGYIDIEGSNIGGYFGHTYTSNDATVYTISITSTEYITRFAVDDYTTAFQGLITAEFNTPKLNTLEYLLVGCDILTSATLPSLLPDVTVAYQAFSWCKALQTVNNMSSLVNVVDATQMFLFAIDLETIDISAFTNLVNANGMFNTCSSLHTITGLEVLNNVRYASFTFLWCESLTSIDTSAFANVMRTYIMFYGCTALTSIDISMMTNTIDANYMFAYCELLNTIDVSELTSLRYVTGMFYGCSSLTDICMGKEDFKALVLTNNSEQEFIDTFNGTLIQDVLSNNKIRLKVSGDVSFYDFTVTSAGTVTINWGPEEVDNDTFTHQYTVFHVQAPFHIIEISSTQAITEFIINQGNTGLITAELTVQLTVIDDFYNSLTTRDTMGVLGEGELIVSGVTDKGDTSIAVARNWLVTL